MAYIDERHADRSGWCCALAQGGPSQRWNVGEAFEESIGGGSTVVYSIGLGLGQWMTASMPCSSSFASSNCPLLESFGA